MYCQNICTVEAVIYILLFLILSAICDIELINSQSHVEECVLAHRDEYVSV